MARVPYIEEEGHPELSELIGRVKAGRSGSLLNVYKVLLHSPKVTEAWMGLIDAIRTGTTLDPRTREIAIIRAAHANRSEYEIRQHIPRYALAAGLTKEECDAIRSWPEASGLSDRDAAVVAYTDAVTRDVSVSDDVFESLAKHFPTREIVELTIVVGTYNMHARLIEPLRVDLEPPAS
jgi:alkylhydroperoxidase family enzyme